MNTTKKNDLEYCLVAGNTDVGLVRKANEDNLDFFDCENGRVVVVCDGMGGHVGGAVASKTAIDAIRSFLIKNYFSDPQQGIVEALNEANKAILEKTYSDPALQGMGSTGVILIVRSGKVYYGSIGDSRIYIIRDRKITRLTKDESYVQMLVDAGMNPEEAEHHPRKNEITNALGLQGMTPAKTGMIDDPHAGDSFLLCSDGLTGMVPEAIISKVVSDKSVPLQRRVDQLIDLAKRGGGVDNITVQIVEFVIDPSALPSPDKKLTILKTAVIGVLAAVILGIGGWYLFLGKKDNGDGREKISIQLPELKLTPGERSIKLFTIQNANDNTTILQFNPEYFKGTSDLTINEKIPGDSIVLSTSDLYTKTSNQERSECGLEIPGTADDFPEEWKVIFLGKKSVYTISCKMKVVLADGGSNKIHITQDKGEDNKTNTPNHNVKKTQISNYETSCTRINIIAAEGNTGSLGNDIFTITTNYKLQVDNVDNDNYSIRKSTNHANDFNDATVIIKTPDKPITIRLNGNEGSIIIKYNPEKKDDPNKGQNLEERQDSVNKVKVEVTGFA